MSCIPRPHHGPDLHLGPQWGPAGPGRLCWAIPPRGGGESSDACWRKDGWDDTMCTTGRPCRTTALSLNNSVCLVNGQVMWWFYCRGWTDIIDRWGCDALAVVPSRLQSSKPQMTPWLTFRRIHLSFDVLLVLVILKKRLWSEVFYLAWQKRVKTVFFPTIFIEFSKCNIT